VRAAEELAAKTPKLFIVFSNSWIVGKPDFANEAAAVTISDYALAVTGQLTYFAHQ